MIAIFPKGGLLKKLIICIRNYLRSKSVFLPFWLMRIVPLPFGFFRKGKRLRKKITSSVFCIEAGVGGWELIEFKEFYMSACEYLGNDRVYKVQISTEESYLQQIKKALDEKLPTHYLYDPRTASQSTVNQNWWTVLWQAFSVAFLLHLRGVIPIVLLTDFSYRKWRMQSAIITAKKGVVMSFVSLREASPIFPHNRIVSPVLLPLSKTTLTFLDDLYVKRSTNLPRRAYFMGSLYEPRTTMLRVISENLKKSYFSVEIRGRNLGSKKISSDEYWSAFSNELIVITTAGQIESSFHHKDWSWLKQFQYRYLEAIACGALLIAPEIAGISRYFVPGEHFVSFTTAEQASKAIEYYLTNEGEREKIARNGREKAKSLIEAHSFWLCIDIMLGKDSLT